MSILDYFPRPDPRPTQIELLEAIEANWHSANVFAINAPTATGKTEIALTIARWALAEQGWRGTILSPDNINVDQFLGRYPEVTPMHRKEAYHCETHDSPCGPAKCKGCPYIKAKSNLSKAGVRLMNYHTYMAHRNFTPVLIVDEAHKMVDVLAELREVSMWRSEFQFPEKLQTVADVIEWGQGYLKKHPRSRIRFLLKHIIAIQRGSEVVYVKSRYKGHADVALRVVPGLDSDVPDWMWPYTQVRKIVLMSATIGNSDIKDLGLGRRGAVRFDCDSPIPVENRPFLYKPMTNMGHKYVDMALPHLAEEVRKLLARHPEKGLIHLPYSLAGKFADLLDDPRILTHDGRNKSKALDLFRDSPPSEGRVLLASGMYEGVDLPYDAARWQVIGKVPYLSLGDPTIAKRSELDPDWYTWQAVKRLIQSAGRIVRAPDDYGITYCFDVNLGGLISRAGSQLPDYFKDAIRVLDRKQQWESV